MGTPLVKRLEARYFRDSVHPYRIFETEVRKALPAGGVILDAGCGRTAPILSGFRGAASRLIGVDLVDFTTTAQDLELYKGDLAYIPVPSCSIDVVMARSVMEHIEKPTEVYREMYRVLKPGGHFIFLTANLWDYASLIAILVPNRLHPWIVSKTQGRKPDDVFPTRYRTNTHRAIKRFARSAGFQLERIEYLGQQPDYFQFSTPLFLLGTAYEKLISRYEGLAFLRGWILADLRKTKS